MCTVCGCGENEEQSHEHPHNHSHEHDHHHHEYHSHDHDYSKGEAGVHVAGLSQSRLVSIEQDILAKNNAYADTNRGYFAQHGILTLNLVSSPGAGKTTQLTKTIEALDISAEGNIHKFLVWAP